MNCYLRASVVTGCLISMAACSNSAGSPTAPNSSFSSTAASTEARAAVTSNVEVCHRAGDKTSAGDKFVPISVAEAAVGAHLAHGDGLIGQAVPGTTATFGPRCVTSVAAPVTITFEDLVVNGAPFISLVESGFEIRVTGPSSFTRAWEAASLIGKPAPSLVFRVPAGSTATSGAILLTPDEGAFRFVSVDLYSSLTATPYQFIGYSVQPVDGGVNFTEVFNMTGMLPGTMGNFVTVTNPYSEISIDRLMIILTSPTTACCENSMGLDNIVVSR